MFCNCVCGNKLYAHKIIGYGGVPWDGYLCTLLVLAVDKCHSTLNHLFIEISIVVDWVMGILLVKMS